MPPLQQKKSEKNETLNLAIFLKKNNNEISTTYLVIFLLVKFGDILLAKFGDIFIIEIALKIINHGDYR